VGTDILPRPQVVSKIWVYIKANNLQNEKDKREIICDDKLQAIFRKKKISMFKMNAEYGRHLLEKVDRSEYQHEEANGSDSE
jgi:upstream activation factor subunit UAF30